MIAYFSGTGNSLYVAKELASTIDDQIISVASETLKSSSNYTYNLKDGERIGIVFPVYSWGAPDQVIKWLSNSNFNFEGDSYAYVIVTCGADIGNAVNPIEKLLSSKGIKLNLSYSIAMPNNYMVMGDVYDKNTEAKLLESSSVTISEIASLITNYTSGVQNVTKGGIPAIKTSAINFLFNKFAKDTKNFKVSSACTSCGICEQICPTATIKLENGKPVWNGDCAQCLACLNYCPVKAINYGDKTKNKGRYTNPNIKLDEMKFR